MKLEHLKHIPPQMKPAKKDMNEKHWVKNIKYQRKKISQRIKVSKYLLTYYHLNIKGPGMRILLETKILVIILMKCLKLDPALSEVLVLSGNIQLSEKYWNN